MKFSRPEEELLILGIRMTPDEQAKACIERLLQGTIDWDFLLHQAARHKVTSMFWHNLHASEAIPLQVRQQLKATAHRAGLRGVFLTGEFITISRKFRANEISFIPLKGPVLAAQIYEEVALREFSDVDIMVHKTDLPAAFKLLGELGYKVFESDSSSLPYRDSEHEHHSQFLKPSGKILVELHWSLGQSWYSFAGNTDSFWRGADYEQHMGLTLRVAKREDSLLFLCAHGYKHYWSRLAWIGDVSQALLTWPDLDWTYIFEEARRSRMYRVMLLGLYLAHDTLGAPLPERVLEAIRANSQLIPIAGEIQRLLFSDETIATLDMKKYLFHLHMSESLPDKLAYLRYFLSRQLTPNSVDKARVTLPPYLSWLYYLLRIFRLLREYGASVVKALLGGRILTAFERQPIRVLYVLNAMGGGASLGIYEFLRRMPKTRIVAYAVVPPGTTQQFEQMRPLFEDVCVTPLLWWNRKTELDPLRRAARAFGSLRRGITLAGNVETIKGCIERWQIDVVHTGTALTLAGPLAAQALGVPNIWHIKESIGSENRVRFTLPDDQLVAYMDGLSGAVIAMSEYIGGVFRKHGSEKLVVIPDGVDLSAYEGGTSRKLRDQLGVDEQTVLIGMVAGTTSTWKRHDLFIEAAAMLIPKVPAARFVIVGEKPNPKARFPNDGALKYHQALERQAAQIRPTGQFEFVDHVADVADLMRSLDILVHPCDTEPFGRVAIEAQAAGTPVVGALTGGIDETVINGETGLLVSPGNVPEFAEAIERLIGDAALRRRFGAAGKSHATTQYPVDAMVERLSALYGKVLNEARV